VIEGVVVLPIGDERRYEVTNSLPEDYLQSLEGVPSGHGRETALVTQRRRPCGGE